MNELIEQMMKDRLPVHERCLGIGFNEEEKKFLKPGVCNRIEPIEVFDLIDEETGQADDETPPSLSNTDPACRCAAYINPSSWWRRGRCPLASHFDPYFEEEKGKQRVGQQKQKKKK